MIHHKVTITFERIQDDAVVGYEILKNLVDIDPVTKFKTVRQKRVTFIPNNGISPLLVEKELILDDSYANQKITGSVLYRIPNDNLIINKNCPFEVSADNILMPEDTYILHEEGCYLIFYSISETLPVIKARYYIDAIKYEIDATDSLSYTIVPGIDETLSVIGRHTELI